MLDDEDTLYIISELSTEILANRPQMNDIVLFPKVGKDRGSSFWWETGFRSLACVGRGRICDLGGGHDCKFLTKQLDQAIGKAIE